MVQRLSPTGAVRWQTTLPVGPVAYEGVVQMRADEDWKPRPKPAWTPQTWVCFADALTVSGDAVLVSFTEMPRSGIGLAYVLSLSDGSLRFTTKLGPIHEKVGCGDGGFLVGYQGYDAFETLHYSPGGDVAMQWPSHGYYVVRQDDVRVIEMENCLPSRMHLVRLRKDGSIEKGAWLDGSYTSRPHVRADGTLLFFRNSAMLLAKDLSIDDRLSIAETDDTVHSTPLVGNDVCVYFAYRQISQGTDSILVRVDG
jgi:hypothetical protein